MPVITNPLWGRGHIQGREMTLGTCGARRINEVSMSEKQYYVVTIKESLQRTYEWVISSQFWDGLWCLRISTVIRQVGT